MCKSQPAQETDGKESDETLSYDMGLPTGHKYKKRSHSKHMHTHAKIPKLSDELLLQKHNEVHCEGESSNVNATVHVDQSTVPEEMSFDCKVGNDEMNQNSNETIVISIHHSLTEGS